MALDMHLWRLYLYFNSKGNKLIPIFYLPRKMTRYIGGASFLLKRRPAQ